MCVGDLGHRNMVNVVDFLSNGCMLGPSCLLLYMLQGWNEGKLLCRKDTWLAKATIGTCRNYCM